MANIRSRTPIPPHHRPDTLPLRRDSDAPRYPHSVRPRTPSRDPWENTAETYAWVQRHCLPLDSRGKKTEKWVLEQQIFYSNSIPRGHRKAWDDMIFVYDDEAPRRMRDEEQIRQFAAQRQKQKARVIDEKLRQIESRIRHRREMEKERLRASAEQKERERSVRAKADQAFRDAWTSYEKGWQDLVKCPHRQLSFSTIPWPLTSMATASALDEITATEIGFFLLSPLHSEGQTGKERIRRAQLIWHPDRFQKILGRVVAMDKDTVEAGAGIVARCLNDLMAQETEKARR